MRLACNILLCVAAPVLCTSAPRAAARRYRLLEIELDAVYRSMLLLKKKKYAAVKVRQTRQSAGADRRTTWARCLLRHLVQLSQQP
jgi:hypothetical protein